MDKVLYISGDGLPESKRKWHFYFDYFDPHWIWKNYYFSKTIKSNTRKCDILNFQSGIKLLWFNLKFESLGITGTTFFRNKTTLIINYCIRKIICRKIKLQSYDLIIFSDNLYFLDSSLIKRLKKLSTSKIVLLCNVSPKYLLSQSEKDNIPHYDIIFISDPGHEIEWMDLGAQNVVKLPISAGCPSTFQKIINKCENKKIYDVTFIGRLDGPLHYHRLDILNYLASHGVALNIWTWNNSKESLQDFPLLKSIIRGNAYGEKMVRILSQSKISLNIHILTQPFGGNLRLFELPATKSLQIADKCPSDWFIDGHEIVLYKDKKDLLIRINHYLNNEQERNKISNNGYKRLLAEHTYKHRIDKFLHLLKDDNQYFKI